MCPKTCSEEKAYCNIDQQKIILLPDNFVNAISALPVSDVVVGTLKSQK